MVESMLDKMRWRLAWATEMTALGHDSRSTAAGDIDRSNRGPASTRFFRMWQVRTAWQPVSAADFLTANRGQVQVAVAEPPNLRTAR